MNDDIGKKFGRLTVIGEVEQRGLHGLVYWNVKCDCGVERRVPRSVLRRGLVRSCGCLAKEINADKHRTHGMRDTRVYGIWQGMKNRCRNQSLRQWDGYGGRGIRVCDRWNASFENFIADMGMPPTDKHSIDRIDNDGHYEPGNCRWATNVEQCRNRSSNTWVEINGCRKVMAQWIEEGNLKPATVWQRIANGWDPVRALTQPVARNMTKLKQLTDHAQALRVDLHAAEAAGAAIPAIHDAKELLEAAILKAVEAINQGATSQQMLMKETVKA